MIKCIRYKSERPRHFRFSLSNECYFEDLGKFYIWRSNVLAALHRYDRNHQPDKLWVECISNKILVETNYKSFKSHISSL